MPNHRLTILFITIAIGACATYQLNVDEARRDLIQNPSKAVERLRPLAEKPSDDQLLYVLDYAMALQLAGEYKESAKNFMMADKLAEAQDYTSLSRQAGSLLLSEEMVQYKGDDYEKIFINVFSAINYLLLHDLESAGVETRRLTDKLKYYIQEEKKPYEQNPFAIYLNGHIWEANKNYDSALIDFERAYNLGINNQYIKEDLLRSAMRAGRRDKVEKYKSEFQMSPQKNWQDNKKGELILIYQQGWGPRKVPNPASPRLPILTSVGSYTKSAKMLVPGLGEFATALIFDIENIAIKTLNDQMGALVAKRAAGMVAKEAVAKRVSKDNEVLGLAMFIAMHASDRADVRQWSTLPQTIQIARAYLPTGEHSIDVKGFSAYGEATGEAKTFEKVKIRPQKKTFIMWRSYK
jgi:hypothetical protein